VYTVLNGLVGIVFYVSGGRIEPRDYDLKEYWTWKAIGRPPWFIRAIQKRLRGRNQESRATTGQDEHDDTDGTFSVIRFKTISHDYSTVQGETKM
jgi:AGZA family xanthine/uracil permease-like MFS transporter